MDLTLPLYADVPVRPGDPGVVMDELGDIATEGYRLTHLSMGTHTGTHIDAPSHIIESGDTLNNISFDALVGSCCLVKVASEPGSSIALDDLIIHKEAIRSTGRFDMPTPSVKQEMDVHKVFLEAGIPIVECLNLENLTQSHFEIVVAPLPLRNREGAPCRVLGLLNRSS
jgi:kynurenine formamidase